MSFQAYLDNIQMKTGISPVEFKKLAENKGLLKEGIKTGEFISWLKKDYQLGHGHAMAIYTWCKGLKEDNTNVDEAIKRHFAGAKQVWRAVFDRIVRRMSSFGNDIQMVPGGTYISILRKNSKIAIIQVSNTRMDVGIKLKGVKAGGQLEAAGKWNTMVTHRVRVSDSNQPDKQLITWLKQAYSLYGKK
jgi:hypothetical protein